MSIRPRPIAQGTLAASWCLIGQLLVDHMTELSKNFFLST
jgi:hypothetical protein